VSKLDLVEAMGLFTVLGSGITKAPWLWVGLMPTLSIVLIIVGFLNYEVEDNVGNIWVPESTSYAKDEQYKRDIHGGSSSSVFLAISRPRKGGNVLTAPLLLELRDRLDHVQNTTQVALHSSSFSLEDVCYNPAGAYTFPCLRMTALDCYAEGGYDFDSTAAAAWRVMAKPAIVAAQKPGAFDHAIEGLFDPIVKTGLVTAAPCNTACVYDGQAEALALAFGTRKGTWEKNTTCNACLTLVLSSMSIPAKDIVYAQVMDALAIQLGLNYTGAALKAVYNVTTEKDAWNIALRNLPQMVTAVNAQVDAGVDQILAASTPYTFRTYGAGAGTPRLHLANADGTMASDADVLSAASSTCYTWDGGAVLPANIPILMYGEASPEAFSDTQPLTSVEALQHVYSFLIPKDLQKRLAARPPSKGGPISLTEEQAGEVLAEFKKAFEKSFSEGWDDPSNGNLENTAFVDDVGAPGSFANTLSELTTDSIPLIAIYGLVTVCLCALFFASRDLVASRAILVTTGSLLALLGCFAALGLSALLDISFNVVHMWIIPFIIVGIGIDDMFMLTLSAELADSSQNPARSFIEGFSKVASPITMTSLVNASMFAILAFASDIRAVYQAGYTGLIATLLLYFTMLISFSSLVFLDARRRANCSYECLPCFQAPRRDDPKKAGETFGFAALLYNRAYKPLITTCVGKSSVLLIALALLILAIVGMVDVPIGLDLQDFFSEDAMNGKYSANKQTYFPVWPVTLNWGELDYTDANVQLKMAKQWENVLNCKHIAGDLRTTLVWTAALAEWGLSNNDAACAATFKENDLGLKLKADGGICVPITGTSKSQCPVFEDFTIEQFVACVAKWKQSGTDYDVIGPRLKMGADGNTPLIPIRYSKAAGSVLYATELRTTDDYTSLIEETRRYVDDDVSMHAWMSDIPFSYWEQYLTVNEFMYTAMGISLAAGFAISFVFLVAELAMDGRGTCLARIGTSFVGALVIVLTSGISFLTVVGFCGLASVKLSGFTAMSCLMSTALAVEYSVHILHHFIAAPFGSALQRIEHATKWLFAPSAMAFLTSAVSISMMAFSEFRFVRLYFFVPLAIAVLSSYFFGNFALPSFLALVGLAPGLGTQIPIKSATSGESVTEKISRKISSRSHKSNFGAFHEEQEPSSQANDNGSADGKTASADPVVLIDDSPDFQEGTEIKKKSERSTAGI